jgi:hypothetical protein
VFQTAGHANLAASGAAISITTLTAARKAMREQTSLDGFKLNIAPKYLVVGAAKETEAEQITTPIIPQTVANANTIGPKLTVVAEANLSGNGWYVMADPMDAPCFLYGHLQGASGPQIRTDEPFGVLGWAVQAVLDFGVAAIDYRGAYKNPGD